MIQITQPLTLSAADVKALSKLQTTVDAAPTYEAQVVLAGKKWDEKNAALFKRIRNSLESLCPGARRCCYCEDSLADEVEHIRPKSWFPDEAFVADNYLFACGPCNSPKGSAYGVVSATGVLTEAFRDKKAGVFPPPSGQEALLHPRHNNPLDFLSIDLINTFRFRPKLGLNPVDKTRAEYTIRILQLDLKDPLDQARKEAFGDFAGRLAGYYLASQNGATQTELQLKKDEILKKQHISVWREMQRQANTPLLSALFALVPGAETW